MARASVGYSGTSLVKKLGIKDGTQIVALNAPKQYPSLLGKLPRGSKIVAKLAKDAAFIHLFTDEQVDLKKQLSAITKSLAKDGILWVSWPKKSSGVPTDITEDTLRVIILPTGLVDVKVCAIDETWSGLKFLWRLEKR